MAVIHHQYYWFTLTGMSHGGYALSILLVHSNRDVPRGYTPSILLVLSNRDVWSGYTPSVLLVHSNTNRDVPWWLCTISITGLL